MFIVRKIQSFLLIVVGLLRSVFLCQCADTGEESHTVTVQENSCCNCCAKKAVDPSK